MKIDAAFLCDRVEEGPGGMINAIGINRGLISNSHIADYFYFDFVPFFTTFTLTLTGRRNAPATAFNPTPGMSTTCSFSALEGW